MPANPHQDPFPSEKKIRTALAEGGTIDVGPVEVSGGLMHTVGALGTAIEQTKLRRYYYSTGRFPTVEELAAAIGNGHRLTITVTIEATKD